jgi:DNA-binding beta-propeller fold protein YncE
MMDGLFPRMLMSRRKWLGLLLLSACARRKATGYPGYALVATAAENSISAVDLTSFQLVKQIEVGASPAEVITGQDRSLVLTPSTGSVHVISPELKRLSSHKLADEVSGIRLTPDQSRLVAMAGRSRELIVADPMSFKVLRRHKLHAEPVALDVTSAPYAAVSTGRDGVVELFHLGTGQRWRAQMAGEIGNLRFRADGQLLLAANLRDRSLRAFDVPALRVIADLPLAFKPQNLCFTPDQGQLFVSGEGMDAVAIVFPYGTLEVEQTVLAGRDPGVMACSAIPAYLFVASNSGSDVCILNVDKRRMIGIVAVGKKPSFITITPDSQYALVLDEDSNDMAVIRVTAIRSNRNKSGAALFTMVQVGAKPVHAAVVPKPL